MIDAVPTRVIINESPIDDVKTYQITFSHKGAGRPFTVGPNTVKAIIAELQDRGRYIDKDADKFLTGILTKYEDNDLAEFNNQVLQCGYYLVDDKIINGTSKAALVAFAKYIAQEFGKDGITANIVSPGMETDANAFLPDEFRQKIASMTPLGRIGNTEDVARVVAFFASDDSRFMTGTYVPVNGGILMD